MLPAPDVESPKVAAQKGGWAGRETASRKDDLGLDEGPGWGRHAPTLSEIRTWPATVDVPAAARALGISRSHAYTLVERGQFPATVLFVGQRLRVITASLIAILEH